MSSSPDVDVEQLVDEAGAEAVDGLAPPGEDVEAVLRDVQDALAGLANLDVDLQEPRDLDRVRQGLPTEPHRALLVQAALPDPLRHALEYVHPSDRQAGYWRRRRDRSTPEKLSDAELKERIAFGEAAREQRGETGVVATGDGRVIPRSAANVGEEVRGQEFAEDDVDEEKGLGLLGRILDRL